MSYDIYTAVDSIGHAKSTQNHPESVVIALNQGGRVKNDVIMGWVILITDGIRITHLRITP